jgi:predicted transcriptional regulator
MSKNPLEILFNSELRLKILKLFLNHPERSFSAEELSGRVQKDRQTVKKEVKKLVESGLIIIKR